MVAAGWPPEVQAVAMDPEGLRKAIGEARFNTGFTEMAVEDLALTTTRLGSIMLDIGQRTWVLYYAAKAGNWKFAQSQFREISELLQVGALLRPDYAQHFETFLAEGWSAVGKAIHDERAYQALGGEGFDGYFPAYRRSP